MSSSVTELCHMLLAEQARKNGQTTFADWSKFAAEEKKKLKIIRNCKDFSDRVKRNNTRTSSSNTNRNAFFKQVTMCLRNMSNLNSHRLPPK